MTRHDINNQTTTLMGHMALLKMKQPHLALNEQIRKAEAAAERISSMIQFTKEYENVGVNAPTWQNVRTLVDRCVKNVHIGRIQVMNDIPPGVELLADPLVANVFQNLIQNSIRHGGNVTDIRFSIEEKDGFSAIVYQDNGGGIPEEMKERLFTKGFGKDHGLGLFLSREILAITGIIITEEGEGGKGAKFVMTVSHNGMMTK
jgi:signal transduction histidine kinase